VANGHAQTATPRHSHSGFAAQSNADGNSDLWSGRYTNEYIDSYWYRNLDADRYVDDTASTSANGHLYTDPNIDGYGYANDNADEYTDANLHA